MGKKIMKVVRLENRIKILNNQKGKAKEARCSTCQHCVKCEMNSTDYNLYFCGVLGCPRGVLAVKKFFTPFFTTEMATPRASAFAGVLLALDKLPARLKSLILVACDIESTEQHVATMGQMLQNSVIDLNPTAAKTDDRRPWLENGKHMRQFQERVQKILLESSHTAALITIAEYNKLFGVVVESGETIFE